MPTYNDVWNSCKSTEPNKFGGLVVGVCGARVEKKQETFEFKSQTNVLVMHGSGNYNQTGSPNMSGIAQRLSSKFDDPTYYSN